ncbi:MAG: hypothetical protein RL750_206, partial [Bacteroidota bacterium]
QAVFQMEGIFLGVDGGELDAFDPFDQLPRLVRLQVFGEIGAYPVS